MIKKRYFSITKEVKVTQFVPGYKNKEEKKIEIKTTRNERGSKYSPMSEANTCIEVAMFSFTDLSSSK